MDDPGTAIKKARCGLELTQDQLAATLGVWRTTVARWENGDRKVDIDLLDSLSEKLGIPKRDLRPDLFERFAEVAQ